MSEICNDAKIKCQFYTWALKNLLVTADKGSLINLTSVIKYVLEWCDPNSRSIWSVDKWCLYWLVIKYNIDIKNMLKQSGYYFLKGNVMAINLAKLGIIT